MGEHSSENCPICLVSFTDSSDVEPDLQKTACEHLFHRHCLSEWFRIGIPGNYCPLCKQIVLDTETAALSSQTDEQSSTERRDSGEHQQSHNHPIGEVRQQQNLHEIEQIFERMQTHFVAMNQAIVRSRLSILDIPRPLPSERRQQQVDSFSCYLSSAQESLNSALELTSQALGNLLQLRQMDTGTLDRDSVHQMVIGLQDLYCEVRQHASRTLERLEDLEGVVYRTGGQSGNADEEE